MLFLLHKVPRLQQGPGDERKMALGALQVSSEDGALQAVPSGQDGGKAVWPSTLGEGDKERVDASQGKDGVKVKSKQKRKKENKSEEQRWEGLKEKGAGRQTKASKPEEGSGDWRGACGPSRGAPVERGRGPSGEAVNGGDRDAGAESRREDTQAEAGGTSTTGQLAYTKKVGELVGRKQLRGEVEEGKDMWAGEIKKEENEKCGAGNEPASVTVVSRKVKKRKKGNAGGAGAPEAKERRQGDGELGRDGRAERAVRRGLGRPGKDVRWEKRRREERSRCGLEQGRDEEEEPVDATSRGRDRKRDHEATKGPEEEGEGRWRWYARAGPAPTAHRHSLQAVPRPSPRHHPCSPAPGPRPASAPPPPAVSFTPTCGRKEKVAVCVGFCCQLWACRGGVVGNAKML